MAQRGPRVEIPGSEVRKVYSKIVGQEYELHILFPRGFDTSKGRFPVVYLMDSQWDFPLVKSLIGQQFYDGFIPPVLLVGVTWAGSNANHDSLRARDYTPTNEKRLPQSGGAAKFLSFLKNELIPWMETDYKGDKNNRTLMGCSLGGLFTLYALFTEPNLFQGYVAASPAIGWDAQVLSRYEREFARESLFTKPSRVYMTIGDVESGVPAYQEWVSRFQEKTSPRLSIQSTVLTNTGHSGTKGETYSRGLQFVFERPRIKLDKSLLNKYAGIYQFPDNSSYELKVEGDQLVLARLHSSDRIMLYAASDTELYSTAEFLNLRIKTNREQVEGFQLERFWGSEFAKKVK